MKSTQTILIILASLVLLAGIAYWGSPGTIIDGVRQHVRWKAGLTRAEVQVDDHRWVYLKGGEGEAILFVHGFGADKDSWWTFLLGFSGSYAVVVPDLPGFGETSRVASAGYDIPSQVRRLNRFVEVIGLDAFHLVGVSMGGYIAAYYAGDHPEKVRSLALIDAAGVESPTPSHAWQVYEKEGRNLLLFRTEEEFDDLMSVLFYRRPWIPAPLKAYFVKKRLPDHPFHRKIVEDLLDSGMNLLEGRLSKIQARTLILWGADDLILHVSSVEKFQEGIKDSQTVIIDDCGHVPYLEKPEETKEAYLRFLSSLQPG